MYLYLIIIIIIILFSLGPPPPPPPPPAPPPPPLPPSFRPPPPPPLSELQATPNTVRTSSRLQQMQNRLRTRMMKRNEGDKEVPETPNKKTLDFKVWRLLYVHVHSLSLCVSVSFSVSVSLSVSLCLSLSLPPSSPFSPLYVVTSMG